MWAEGESTHYSEDRGGCSRGTVPIWVPGVSARTTTAVAHRVQGDAPLFREGLQGSHRQEQAIRQAALPEKVIGAVRTVVIHTLQGSDIDRPSYRQKPRWGAAASSSSRGPTTTIARCPRAKTSRQGRARVGFSGWSPVSVRSRASERA